MYFSKGFHSLSHFCLLYKPVGVCFQIDRMFFLLVLALQQYAIIRTAWFLIRHLYWVRQLNSKYSQSALTLLLSVAIVQKQDFKFPVADGGSSFLTFLTLIQWGK